MRKQAICGILHISIKPSLQWIAEDHEGNRQMENSQEQLYFFRNNNFAILHDKQEKCQRNKYLPHISEFCSQQDLFLVMRYYLIQRFPFQSYTSGNQSQQAFFSRRFIRSKHAFIQLSPIFFLNFSLPITAPARYMKIILPGCF